MSWKAAVKWPCMWPAVFAHARQHGFLPALLRMDSSWASVLTCVCAAVYPAGFNAAMMGIMPGMAGMPVATQGMAMNAMGQLPGMRPGENPISACTCR